MRMVKRLVTALCVLGLVVTGCGGDDAEGTDSTTDTQSGTTPTTPASSDAMSSGDAEEQSTAPTDDELATACSAYCVYETQTCPDTSDDADNDTAACEVSCMDPANASGLSGSLADSEACYLQTSAYFACLQGLNCEDFDAHWIGLATDPEYVDACTETLAEDACQ